MTGTSREAQIVDAMLKAGIEEGRREAFREAVEALRGLLAVDDPSAWGAMNGDEAVERAADFIERSFLSPDNPEGNA